MHMHVMNEIKKISKYFSDIEFGKSFSHYHGAVSAYRKAKTLFVEEGWLYCFISLKSEK